MNQKPTHCPCGRALGDWGTHQPEGLWRRGSRDQCRMCYQRDLRNGKVLREPTDWSTARCKHCNRSIREPTVRAADAPGTVPGYARDCCKACYKNGGTTLERAAAREEEASRRKRAPQKATAERDRVRAERDAARTAARADREAAKATEPTPEPDHTVTDPALARYLRAREARLNKRTRPKLRRTSI